MVVLLPFRLCAVPAQAKLVDLDVDRRAWAFLEPAGAEGKTFRRVVLAQDFIFRTRSRTARYDAPEYEGQKVEGEIPCPS